MTTEDILDYMFKPRSVIVEDEDKTTEINLPTDRKLMLNHITSFNPDLSLYTHFMAHDKADGEYSYREKLQFAARLAQYLVKDMHLEGTTCLVCNKDGHEAVNCPDEDLKHYLQLDFWGDGEIPSWEEYCQFVDSRERQAWNVHEDIIANNALWYNDQRQAFSARTLSGYAEGPRTVVDIHSIDDRGRLHLYHAKGAAPLSQCPVIKLTSGEKCANPSCFNRSNQGRFVRRYCYPCITSALS